MNLSYQPSMYKVAKSVLRSTAARRYSGREGKTGFVIGGETKPAFWDHRVVAPKPDCRCLHG